jgi:hypothetical protein
MFLCIGRDAIASLFDTLTLTPDATVHRRLRSLCDVAFKYSNVRQFASLFADQAQRTVKFLDSKIGVNDSTNCEAMELFCFSFI